MFSWIDLLRHKSEVFKFFKEFQALVERMFDHKTITMQTDWGGKYEHLNSFFRSMGITHHVSYPHTNQQNGVAKRKHQHIIEVGLARLAKSSKPLKFWGQAFLTATHLINHTRTKILDYDTPIHRLLGVQPDYSTLCVFGCACWPHLRPYNSHKLQVRSIWCAFLGYSNLHKDYKCLDISSGQIYISRDVIFDGTLFSFAELHPKAGARYTSEVFLLPNDSRDNSDLPLANIPPDSGNSQYYLCPQQLVQLQEILAPTTHQVDARTQDDSAPGSTSNPVDSDPGPSSAATSSALQRQETAIASCFHPGARFSTPKCATCPDLLGPEGFCTGLVISATAGVRNYFTCG
jgi:hypothetical protein